MSVNLKFLKEKLKGSDRDVSTVVLRLYSCLEHLFSCLTWASLALLKNSLMHLLFPDCTRNQPILLTPKKNTPRHLSSNILIVCFPLYVFLQQYFVKHQSALHDKLDDII